MTDPTPTPRRNLLARLAPAGRLGFLAVGFLLVGVGIVGVFVPLLPSTIFFILAAWCFSRSSPRFESWLLNHPWLGASLRNWRQNGAISRNAKISACLGMTLGYVLFWLGAHPKPWLAAVVALALFACAAYVVSRPSAYGQR